MHAATLIGALRIAKRHRQLRQPEMQVRRPTRYSAALADFSKAIEVAPKDEVAYRERGMTAVMQNQFDAALPDFDKAIELKPDDAFAYKFRGFAEIGLNQWDKAVADFTTAIAETAG